MFVGRRVTVSGRAMFGQAVVGATRSCARPWRSPGVCPPTMCVHARDVGGGVVVRKRASSTGLWPSRRRRRAWSTLSRSISRLGAPGAGPLVAHSERVARLLDDATVSGPTCASHTHFHFSGGARACSAGVPRHVCVRPLDGEGVLAVGERQRALLSALWRTGVRRKAGRPPAGASERELAEWAQALAK